MSQQDNFSGGFFLGAVLGGIVGGVVGAMLANRTIDSDASDIEADGASAPDLKSTGKRSLRVAPPSEPFEITAESARRSLEEKIAQLNDAIDDVRDQLKQVDSPVQVRSMAETDYSDEI